MIKDTRSARIEMHASGCAIVRVREGIEQTVDDAPFRVPGEESATEDGAAGGNACEQYRRNAHVLLTALERRLLGGMEASVRRRLRGPVPRLAPSSSPMPIFAMSIRSTRSR